MVRCTVYGHTKFNMPNSDNSLMIHITSTAKCRLHVRTVFLFGTTWDTVHIMYCVWGDSCGSRCQWTAVHVNCDKISRTMDRVWCYSFIRSAVCLTTDRSIASLEASSRYCAIWCFLFQVTVSSSFLKAIR